MPQQRWEQWRQRLNNDLVSPHLWYIPIPMFTCTHMHLHREREFGDLAILLSWSTEFLYNSKKRFNCSNLNTRLELPPMLCFQNATQRQTQGWLRQNKSSKASSHTWRALMEKHLEKQKLVSAAQSVSPFLAPSQAFWKAIFSNEIGSKSSHQLTRLPLQAKQSTMGTSYLQIPASLKSVQTQHMPVRGIREMLTRLAFHSKVKCAGQEGTRKDNVRCIWP